MQVKYTGTEKVKVKFIDGSDRKVMPGQIIEISELNWGAISLSGNFELAENKKKTEIKEKELAKAEKEIDKKQEVKKKIRGDK